MTLITMTTAKAHLRITSSDQDGDIAAKAEQATEIILDYLKSRAHTGFTIATSSIASPTVITTDDAHSFVDGQTVVIADHADSTPSLNGSHVISNVTGSTFTVPVAVTVAGSGGTATLLWTAVTAPRQVISAILLMLTHLWEHRGDAMDTDPHVWEAIRRLLERSRDPAFA
jgi:hypothetical protein